MLDVLQKSGEKIHHRAPVRSCPAWRKLDIQSNLAAHFEVGDEGRVNLSDGGVYKLPPGDYRPFYDRPDVLTDNGSCVHPWAANLDTG